MRTTCRRVNRTLNTKRVRVFLIEKKAIMIENMQTSSIQTRSRLKIIVFPKVLLGYGGIIYRNRQLSLMTNKAELNPAYRWAVLYFRYLTYLIGGRFDLVPILLALTSYFLSAKTRNMTPIKSFNSKAKPNTKPK